MASTKISQHHTLICVLLLEIAAFQSHSRKHKSCIIFSRSTFKQLAAIWPLTVGLHKAWYSSPFSSPHLSPFRMFAQRETSSSLRVCLVSKAAHATKAVSLSWRATLAVNVTRFAAALFPASRRAAQRGRARSPLRPQLVYPADEKNTVNL